MAHRPRIFLSHSKKDALFVERLANDLRVSFVDVWYDDWEIPPGDSLRKRIFTEGIPDSDMFFVYLTPNSLASYWCERELDAAFVQEVERRGGNLSLFVDSDDTRSRLTPDLRALRIPTLDEGSYERSLRLILSGAWRAFALQQVTFASEKSQLRIAEAEKRIAELELSIERLKAHDTADSATVIATLASKLYAHDETRYTLLELFHHLANALGSGTTNDGVRYRLNKLFGLSNEIFKGIGSETEFTVADILGPLIIHRLVNVQPPSGEWGETFYLTDDGKDLVRELENTTA
jgi:hypothetical protein